MIGRKRVIAALAMFGVLAAWLAPIPDTRAVARAGVGRRVAAKPNVAQRGVRLVSDSIALPEDATLLPETPDGELIATNCTACHSAEMILTQPALNAEKWRATIDKMRAIYKAPIAQADDAALIAALTALPEQGRPK